ncbi:hypothetical protein Dimus_003913, partial [Dionaea muscipula]
PYHGAACPMMKFINEQKAQFSRRGNCKRRDSSRGPTRQDHATNPICNKRIGRLSFLVSRSGKTSTRRPGNTADRNSDVLDRRSERATDRWFDDSLLDGRSVKTPDKRSDASQVRTDAKDKSHIQCYVCDQYDHYSTQCTLNPKGKSIFVVETLVLGSQQPKKVAEQTFQPQRLSRHQGCAVMIAVWTPSVLSMAEGQNSPVTITIGH